VAFAARLPYRAADAENVLKEREQSFLMSFSYCKHKVWVMFRFYKIYLKKSTLQLEITVFVKALFMGI
jgi:hypothetical protein